MRKVVVFLVVTFASMLVASVAEAQQLLTFDEMAPTGFTILGSVVCGTDTGFRVISDHFHVIGGTFLQDFTFNSTTHIGYESGRGFPMTLERIGAGTFSLLSFDAAEFYAPPVADRPDAETLTITGFQQGGGTVSYTVNIDGIRDGVGGVDDFEHVVLPNTFVNLTSVVFTGLRSGGASGGVAIDNLEYQLAAPETLGACVTIPLPAQTPTVSISRPLAGNVVGTVVVEATAAANLGVANVQFKVDGENLGEPDVTAPYLISWDSTTVSDGPHTITAEVRDTSDNLAAASVIVTVRNQTVVGSTPHYLELDGVDDYLQVADADQLSFGNGTADSPLTLELWFRPDRMTKNQLLGKWWDGLTSEYRLHLTSGIIRLDLRDNSSNTTISAFTTGTYSSLIGSWHHLAATYDGRGGATAANGITIYVDGVSVPLFRQNSAAYVAMENLSAALQIGREGPNWKQYDGALDEIRLWNVLRTPSQIQTYMTTELSGAQPGLVAYWQFNDGAGALAVDTAPGNHTAALYNGPLWAPGGPMGPAAPDVTPPVISNIVTSNLTSSSITVTFNTSEVATGSVSYAAGASCPCTDVYSPAPATTHVIALSGLSADTNYLFQVKGTDAAGNLQVAPAMSFRTLPPPPDVTAPTVSITRPLAGNVVGIVVVEAIAADDRGVASVQFKVDGVNFGAADETAPYSISWDSTTVSDGPHTITAEARDAANNMGTASVSVTVRNNTVVTPHYLDLDGVDDYLQVADADQLSFGNGTADSPLTFELWFRADRMTKNQLLGKWWDGSTSEYRLHLASGIIRLDLRDNSSQTTISAFTTGTYSSLIGSWHHLAVTYDGRGGATAADGITIYVDGASVPLYRMNNAAYVAMENLSTALQIGREGPNWKQYDGALDEIRLWNVVRTPSQIQTYRTTELSGAEPGLVGYWQFNDGAGATAADSTPGNHTATLFNGPIWVPGSHIP